MHRRVYYLFPDVKSLAKTLSELSSVPDKNKHGMVSAGFKPTRNLGVEILELSERDRVKGIERILWRSDLAIFFVSFFVFLFLLAQQNYSWIGIPLFMMLLSFVIGYVFVTRVPSSHDSDFSQVVKHGEILLALDLKKRDVERIDHQIHARHPEVVSGGVGWTW